MLTQTLLALVLAHGALLTEDPMPKPTDETPEKLATAEAEPERQPTIVLQVGNDFSLKQQAAALRAPQMDPRARFREGVAATVGTVVRAEDGYQYQAILPGDYPSLAALQAHRQTLIDEGYEPRSGGIYQGPPNPEYVVGRGDAEIWRRSRQYADADHLARLSTSVLSYDWATQYVRHPRGQLPEPVALAMQVYHGLMKPPLGKVPPTEEQLRDLVWKHVKPHPGAPAKPEHW